MLRFARHSKDHKATKTKVQVGKAAAGMHCILPLLHHVAGAG